MNSWESHEFSLCSGNFPEILWKKKMMEKSETVVTVLRMGVNVSDFPTGIDLSSATSYTFRTSPLCEMRDYMPSPPNACSIVSDIFCSRCPESNFGQVRVLSEPYFTFHSPSVHSLYRCACGTTQCQ